MSEVRFTEHALNRLRQRGILREQVEQLIARPENTFEGYAGRTVYECIVKHADGTRDILRAVVDHDEDPPVVVTVVVEEDLSRYGGR